MDATLVWRVLGAGACLLGAALACTAQISVRALGKDRQQELISTGAGGRALRAWLDNPLRALLSSLLARVGFTAVAAWLLVRTAEGLWGSAWAWRVAVAVPVVHVLVSEVVLATWAKNRAALVANPALAAFWPVDAALWVLSAPLASVARRVAGALTDADPQAVQSGPFFLEDDVARLWGLSTSADEAPTHQQEKRLLRGVLEFRDAVVRDVMVPRTRMKGVDVDMPLDEIIRGFAAAAHSRMPVFGSGHDQVVGILFITDLLRAQSTGTPVVIRTTMRRPYFVPELMKVSDLLREFQKRRTHLAVVVDEFGTTSGLVTLQDVIEELVGDVRDEEDVAESSIKQLGPASWLMDGRTSTDTAAQVLGLVFPSEGSFETVGGFVITRVGRLPAVGTSLKWSGFTLTVKEADEKLVGRVQFDRDATDGSSG